MTKNLQNDQNCTRNDQTRNQKIKILEKRPMCSTIMVNT